MTQAARIQPEPAPAAHPSWQFHPGASFGSFDGADIGSPVSGFVVDAGPGEGPALHWHPYAETFVILAGRARFTRGDAELEAGAGDLVVVPPDTLHRFVALGPERLRLVAIHAKARKEQTFAQRAGD